MSRLIRADLFRMRKNRTFLICSFVSVGLGVLFAFLYYYAWQNSQASFRTITALVTQYGMDTEIVDKAFSMLPRDNLWAYISILLGDGSITIIAAIIVGSLTASEYTSGTLKNSLSRGYTRLSVFASKMLTAQISVFIISVLYVASGSVVALIFYGFTATVGIEEMLLVLLSYFLLNGAMTALYFMFAVLCRRSGAAISVSIVMPLFVASIFNILAIAWEGLGDLSKYWLLYAITAAPDYVRAGEAYFPILCGAAYFVVSTMIGYLVFRKQDIR